MRHFAALLLSVAGTVAVGETIPIISGEHEGYTRLVLTIDPAKPWRLENVSGRSNLIFEGSHSFGTENIFNRIPKSRLADVSTENTAELSTFRMALNCQCDVNAYAYQNAYIIIDISDPAPKDRLETASVSPAKLEVNFSPDSLPSLDLEIDTRRPDSPHYNATEAENSMHDNATIVDEQVFEEPVEVLVVEDVDPELQKTVDEARDALIRQLSFAADQGLLDFKSDEANLEVTEHEEVDPHHEDSPEPEAAPVASPMENLMNQEQVSIQSVYDIDGRDDPDAMNVGMQCFQDFDFDIQNWGSGEDFSQELSILRTDQLGEFDVTDLKKIHGLIRLYIRYSFDAEADYLVASYQDDIKHPEIYVDLARVMSGRSGDDHGVLQHAIECEGAVGMWALASETGVSAQALTPKDSVLGVFENLPADLRRAIGPRLIEAYLRRDMRTEAQQVSDLISRAHGKDGQAVELSQAVLLMDAGQVPAAESIYQDVATTNTTESVPALMELVELYLREGRDVPRDYVERIELEADTQRGTQQGLVLRDLEIRLLSQDAGEDAALIKLKHEISVDPENAADYKEMGRNVLSGLTHANPDFLKIVMSNLDFIGGNQEFIELRAKLAEEALADGFPNAASVLLNGSEMSEPDNVYLSGLIDAASSNPDGAKQAFANVDNDIARRQLVRLHLASGKFEDALKSIDSISSEEFKSVDPDWYPGSWRQAANEDPAALTIYRLYLIRAKEPTAIAMTEPDETMKNTGADSLAYFRSTLTNTANLQDDISVLGLSEN